MKRYRKHLRKRNYSIPNNRYERHLNILRDIAWNCMSKTKWDETLYKFGYVRFGKYDDNDDDTSYSITADESANDTSYSAITVEYVDDEPINESTTNEPINKSIADPHSEVYKANEPVNELIVDIEFSNKRELYNHYGIDAKTIPVGYEIKMRYFKTNGKMGCLYKLVKK